MNEQQVRHDRRSTPTDGPSASTGQILILMAVFLTGMLGVLGLATDLGFSFAQRRTVQNAADAAALAGARAILRWSTTDPAAPWREVQTLALHPSNRIPGTNQSIAACDFVDDADRAVGACAGGVPATATGVRVAVRELHPTFFIRVIPGAPGTVTTSATATAHVQRLHQTISDGPFIVCGVNTQLDGGGNLSILSDNRNFNSAAYGQTFLIHGPQIARCGLSNNSFKGLADQDDNVQCEQHGQHFGNNVGCLEQYWYALDGVRAGPTRVRIAGLQGCAPGQDDNCVMILPVATNNPPPINSNPRQFYVVQLAAFLVHQSGANTHTGTLLKDYPIAGDGQPGWCPTCGGLAVVRQTS